MKATHRGTCQLCGRSHKINPKYNSIAKHGFTKEHGFFNGTCRGSDNQPLEMSCELLREYVNKHWPADAAQLREYAGRIRSGEAPLNVTFRVGGAWGQDRTGKLVGVRREGHWWIALVEMHDGQREENRDVLRFERGRTEDEIIASKRDYRAKEIEARAAQIENHIEHMRPIVESWEPRELTAI